MKIQLLTEYYYAFLDNFYLRYPGFSELSYEDMLNTVLEQHFADTGAAYFHFGKQGNEVFMIIANCEPMQKRWALENNINYNEHNWAKEIALAQVIKFKPDVFFIESVFGYYGSFLKEVKSYSKKIAAWISTPYSKDLALNDIDIIFSSTPDFVAEFKKVGIDSHYILPAFDSRVLKKINNPQPKTIDLSFVGAWSEIHINRKTLLKAVAKETELQIWGYGYKKYYSRKTLEFYQNYFFPKNPEIDKAYRTEVWGLEMYDILQRSLITLNVHEALLNGNVGNMRMFEASGVGTMILTDHGHNLSSLFEPGLEVESYKSTNEAIEKINYYLKHPQKAIDIGMNAQKRTLKDYNYDNYTAKLTKHFNEIL